MLLFRSEEHVRLWCRQWRVSEGEIFSLEQQWGLARAWYADRLRRDWRRKTAREAQEILAGLGLTSPFWSLES